MKNKVLAGALEKDGGQGILHLVLQIHGVGTQKVSKAKEKSVWLKYLVEGLCLAFFFKSKLQVEDPALQKKSLRTGCWIGQ